MHSLSPLVESEYMRRGRIEFFIAETTEDDVIRLAQQDGRSTQGNSSVSWTPSLWE